MNKRKEEYIALPNNKIGVVLTQSKVAIIDPEDFNLIAGRRWHAGKGGKTSYAKCSMLIDGVRKSVTMHRLLMPKKEGFVTDHADGNGLNNSRSNLRYADYTQNGVNKGLQNKPRTSQYKGVEMTPRWKEGRRKWRALVSAYGKRIYIGAFHDEVEAAKAYDAAALIHHGEFANLNFPAMQGDGGGV